jgi:hypothetical protein
MSSTAGELVVLLKSMTPVETLPKNGTPPPLAMAGPADG